MDQIDIDCSDIAAGIAAGFAADSPEAIVRRRTTILTNIEVTISQVVIPQLTTNPINPKRSLDLIR